MIKSLKYGLAMTFGYIVISTLLLALTAWIKEIGIRYMYDSMTSFNIMLMIIGGIVVSFAGFSFPRILSRTLSDYRLEYPDVPEKYVMQICRGMLIKKYFYNLAIGCFVVAPFINVGENTPIATYYLISIGVCFAIAYIHYNRKYKNL